MKHPSSGVKFLGVWVIVFFALMFAPKAFPSTPTQHKFDAKFSEQFTADWNRKHYSAPIAEMACLYFPQFTAKQAGIPGAGSNLPYVPAHEDCMVVEKSPNGSACGEVQLKPHYPAGNPDLALIAGQTLACKQVRAAIKSVRTANNYHAA